MPYRDKSLSKSSLDKNFLFKLPYDINRNAEHLNLKSFHKILSLSPLLKEYELKIIYSKQFSIRDLFINNFKLISFNFHYKKMFDMFFLP